MSTTRQLLLADVDYSAWANQQLLTACSALTQDQLTRNLGASHRSVLETLRHIFYAERVWRDRLLKNALPPLIEVGDQRLFADPSPEPSLEDLKQKWPDVAYGLRQWLEERTERDLSAELRCLKTRRRTPPHLSHPNHHPLCQPLHPPPRPDHQHAPCPRHPAPQHRPVQLLHDATTDGRPA